MSKKMTDAKQRQRTSIATEGGRHIQIIADPQTLSVLEELKRRLRMRRKTGKIVKIALELLLKEITENTIKK